MRCFVRTRPGREGQPPATRARPRRGPPTRMAAARLRASCDRRCVLGRVADSAGGALFERRTLVGRADRGDLPRVALDPVHRSSRAQRTWRDPGAMFLAGAGRRDERPASTTRPAGTILAAFAARPRRTAGCSSFSMARRSLRRSSSSSLAPLAEKRAPWERADPLDLFSSLLTAVAGPDDLVATSRLEPALASRLADARDAPVALPRLRDRPEDLRAILTDRLAREGLRGASQPPGAASTTRPTRAWWTTRSRGRTPSCRPSCSGWWRGAAGTSCARPTWTRWASASPPRPGAKIRSRRDPSPERRPCLAGLARVTRAKPGFWLPRETRSNATRWPDKLLRTLGIAAILAAAAGCGGDDNSLQAAARVVGQAA